MVLTLALFFAVRWFARLEGLRPAVDQYILLADGEAEGLNPDRLRK